nr:SpoIIE family protein phosphatase [Bacteroidales bacterium]
YFNYENNTIRFLDLSFTYLFTLVIVYFLVSLLIKSYRLERNYSNSQHVQINRQSQQLIDSLNYANYIQNALFPSEKNINKLLPENFIFFKPKDIVSGDFYWIKKIKDKVVVVAADCTGHGIPGAFMSVLAISLLNELVHRNEALDSKTALEHLRRKTINALTQNEKYELSDGMDMAFCVFDFEKMTLQYAGANNSIYIIRNKELFEYKATRNPIGLYLIESPFKNHNIDLQKGDIVYLFTDGFVDQFGGENGKKFRVKRFKRLLLEIHPKPMNEQKEIISRSFNSWTQNKYEQIDDILIMGIKI